MDRSWLLVAAVGGERFAAPTREVVADHLRVDAVLLGATTVDPRTKDFFRAVVEERRRTDARIELPKPEREWRSKGLKVLANATSYVKTVTARVHALQRLSELPDPAFRHAREDYRRIGPAAALNISDSSISAEALGQTPATLERATNNACLDLLTLLGLNLNRPRDQQSPTLESV